MEVRRITKTLTEHLDNLKIVFQGWIRRRRRPEPERRGKEAGEPCLERFPSVKISDGSLMDAFRRKEGQVRFIFGDGIWCAKDSIVGLGKVA